MQDTFDRIEVLTQEFRSHLPRLEQAKDDLRDSIARALDSSGLKASMITGRVKSESSLRRKLIKKAKYLNLTDVTDLVGIRIVAYDSDDADRIGRVMRSVLDCDWENCEDKRDRLRAEQFGYRSDHYVVSLVSGKVLYGNR